MHGVVLVISYNAYLSLEPLKQIKLQLSFVGARFQVEFKI